MRAIGLSMLHSSMPEMERETHYSRKVVFGPRYFLPASDKTGVAA